MRTVQVHEWTGPTGVNFRDVRHASGTYYPDTTPPEVVNILEWARNRGARVPLFYGDKEGGCDWGEENNVTGTVSRSTGPISIPILVSRRSAYGGPAILCDCIVRILMDGYEVYRHPNYHQPEYTIGPAWDGAKVGVYEDGKPAAGFDTEAQAQRWMAFMRGERMGK